MREAAAAMDFELAASCAISCSRCARAAAPDATRRRARTRRRSVTCTPGASHPPSGAHRDGARGWGERFGARCRRRSSSPSGRARRGQDDARAGDLSRARRHRDVTSPTFALVHRYQGRAAPVYHLDCYRLRSAGRADEHRLGRDLRREADRADRMAGARGRPGCRRHTSHQFRICPTTRRGADAGGTYDHAGARRLDVRAHRWPSVLERRRTRPRSRMTERGSMRRALMPAVAAVLAPARARARRPRRRRAGDGPGQLHQPAHRRPRSPRGSRIAAVPLHALRRCWCGPARPPARAARCWCDADALRGELVRRGVPRSSGRRIATLVAPSVSPCRVRSMRSRPTHGRRALSRRRAARGGAGCARSAPGRAATAATARGAARRQSALGAGYGRPAEAQAKWEAAHGRRLPDSAGSRPADADALSARSSARCFTDPWSER